MGPGLLILGPRCPPRCGVQVAIVFLSILDDDVMIMGSLSPVRLKFLTSFNRLRTARDKAVVFFVMTLQATQQPTMSCYNMLSVYIYIYIYIHIYIYIYIFIYIHIYIYIVYDVCGYIYIIIIICYVYVNPGLSKREHTSVHLLPKRP